MRRRRPESLPNRRFLIRALRLELPFYKGKRKHDYSETEDELVNCMRFLLIEDDREIATTLRSVLESAGYQVGYATNGRDGQRMIQETRPALVITDMMMPQLGGFPVLEFLKKLPKPPKVIMITANEGGRHKAYAEMLGVDDYLRKPFAMDVMLEAVERALRPADQAGDGSSKLKRPAKRKPGANGGAET